MLRYTYDPPYNQWYGVKNKNLLRFKVTYGGTVATVSDLPPRGFMPGVMFNVQEDGSNYMWNGLTWDKMDSNPFAGATSSKDGIQGLVPQPKVANREGFLYGGGGWKNLDASDVKTGVFALARIPAAAMERLVQVADQTERYALTTSSVQNGDTVLQQDTHTMYRVVDQTKLDEASGYVAYQAATAQNVAWGNITGTPLTFTPSAHTHLWNEITDKPSTYTPSEHTHDWIEVINKPEIVIAQNHPASHNGIFRGKNLTNIYTLDQISAKLQNNDWSDLYIGDYITKTFENLKGDEETVDFVFADFDYWYGMGDTECATHHILCVPRDCFVNYAQMNSTNTTEGGYPGSAMWATLQSYCTKLNAANCLNGHILTHRDWIPDAVNTDVYSSGMPTAKGATYYTNTMWRDVTIGLMKEPMVYGGPVFSSSGYDIGCGKRQLSLFALHHEFIKAGQGYGGGRCGWWFGAISTAANFCHVDIGGNATSNNASNSYGVRPYLLLS